MKLKECPTISMQKTFSKTHYNEIVKNQGIKNSKSSQGKKILTYKGTPITLSADFSAETRQARREWNDIFNMLKEKKKKPTKNTLSIKVILQI